MVARLGNLMLALTLLSASGAHWAVLQSVAWTVMIIEDAKHESLGNVMARTLSGANPCDLCKRIATSKQSEKRTEFPTLMVKLEFLPTSSRVSIIPPRTRDREFPFASLCLLRHESPPIPPPRSIPA